MSDTPHTDGDTEDADNQSEVSIVSTVSTNQGSPDHCERDEDQDPLVSPGVEIVCGEELEHEEQEVCGEADQHRLVLDVLLRVEAGLRPPPPHPAAHRGPGDGHTLHTVIIIITYPAIVITCGDICCLTFQTQSGANTAHQDQASTPSSLSV